jgi:hypothetical protein
VGSSSLLLLGEVLGLSFARQAQHKSGSSAPTAAGGGMAEVELGRQEHLKLIEGMSSASTTGKAKP